MQNWTRLVGGKAGAGGGGRRVEVRGGVGGRGGDARPGARWVDVAGDAGRGHGECFWGFAGQVTYSAGRWSRTWTRSGAKIGSTCEGREHERGAGGEGETVVSAGRQTSVSRRRRRVLDLRLLVVVQRQGGASLRRTRSKRTSRFRSACERESSRGRAITHRDVARVRASRGAREAGQ